MLENPKNLNTLKNKSKNFKYIFILNKLQWVISRKLNIKNV